MDKIQDPPGAATPCPHSRTSSAVIGSHAMMSPDREAMCAQSWRTAAAAIPVVQGVRRGVTESSGVAMFRCSPHRCLIIKPVLFSRFIASRLLPFGSEEAAPTQVPRQQQPRSKRPPPHYRADSTGPPTEAQAEQLFRELPVLARLDVTPCTTHQEALQWQVPAPASGYHIQTVAGQCNCQAECRC